MKVLQLRFQLMSLLLILCFSAVAQAQDDDTLIAENIQRITTRWDSYSEVDHKVIWRFGNDGGLLTGDVEYDEAHNVVKEYRSYRCANGIDRRKREVVANNLQIVEFVYGNADNIEEKFIHLKDADERIIQTDHFDASGNLIDTWHYRYKTDGYGNWIRKESDWKNYRIPDEKHFILKIVERRTISYF